MAAIVIVVCAAAQHGAAADVMAWTRWESGLVSSKPYANPYADVTVSVAYAGPNGGKIAAHGFWDDGDAFKMRLMFPTAGVWTWKTTCSGIGDVEPLRALDADAAEGRRSICVETEVADGHVPAILDTQQLRVRGEIRP
jgi:hypothetical protein